MNKLRGSFVVGAIVAHVSLTAQPNDHVAARIPIGGTTGWDYLEADAIARRLYVTHEDHVVAARGIESTQRNATAPTLTIP